MQWMETRADERSAPIRLWPDVKSVIMLGMSYAPDHDWFEGLEHKDRGAISAYAQARDYHDVIKSKLKKIARFLIDQAKTEGSDTEPAVKVFVDTAPVMEKNLAAAAGLGWQGKHTVLVSRAQGSWLLLGAIYTTLALPADVKSDDHCGTCTRCLSVCPTDAFPKPYQLDARKCIAYLTIEHKGPIDRHLRKSIGNRIFGCDDCLAVCPWNRFATMSHEFRKTLRPDVASSSLKDLSQLDDEGFRAHFAGTPIKRTGRDRFMRNVLIAMGNSGETDMIKDILPHLNDKAALVRGAAIWALACLLPENEFDMLKTNYLPHETDLDNRDEWIKGKDRS